MDRSTNTHLLLVTFTCLVFGIQSVEIIRPDTCGVSHGCFFNCHDDDCDFLVTWYYKPDIGGVYMSMKMAIHDLFQPEWFAIGLSDDKMMGDDTVIECTRNSLHFDFADVQHSYNDKHYNLPLYNAQMGLRETSGRVHDGMLECNFTRLIDAGGVEGIFNLDRPWYLLAARGMVKGEAKAMHEMGRHKPSVSTFKVDLRQHVSVGSQEVSLFIKLHGGLMILAWVILASIGVVISRYFRKAWPYSLPCGNQLWYQLHRGIMMTTFLCVSASFILVWLEIREFTKMTGASTFQRAHPVLGIVVMGLTLLNPVIACLRPSKISSSRPFFKYVHMFIGTVVYILALLTLGIGVTLERAGAHPYTVWVIVAFAGYVLVFDFILEVHEGYLIKSGRKLLYEIRTTHAPSSLDSLSAYSESPPGTTFKTCLLSVHVCVCVAFGVVTILLLVYI